mgnify:FL=1
MEFIGIFLAGLIGIIVVFFFINLAEKTAKKGKEVYTKHKPSIEKASKKALSKVKDIAKSEEEKVVGIDDDHFKQALQEIEDGKQKEGLWIKCLSLSEGDELKQRSLYLKLRAKELSTNE